LRFHTPQITGINLWDVLDSDLPCTSHEIAMATKDIKENLLAKGTQVSDVAYGPLVV
jgi:hypothetical protein